jgi:DnaK suppressor protein
MSKSKTPAAGKSPRRKAAASTARKPAAAPARSSAAKIKPAAKSVKPAKKPTARVEAKAAKAPADKKLTTRAQAPAVLPPGYQPSEAEPFMNAMQRLYFRQKLMNWKEDILRQTRETLAGLTEDSTQHADLTDRATSETDRALELRARDRQRKLIAKIDAAIARIEDGTYGYCEDTGEPIGLKRLDARPIATLSLEAQERHERRERVYREE